MARLADRRGAGVSTRVLPWYERSVLGSLLRCLLALVSPSRASPFWQTPQKEPKGLCPCIRVWLRQTSLTPSSLQGPAAKGHPWPIAALATSMSLNPLRNDCARPPERGVWCCLTGRVMKKPKAIKQLGARSPVRRPSVGVAQGDEPHGCGERFKGPSLALVRRPPEQHRREGSFA